MIKGGAEGAMAAAVPETPKPVWVGFLVAVLAELALSWT
jgi:hypothetical protein